MEFDEETKITPFNLDEEMDEGHFDVDGTFIFNKKSEQIRDAWLDNIDWGKVKFFMLFNNLNYNIAFLFQIKKDAGGLWQGETEGGDQEASRSPGRVDRADIYENILQYLQPQETITKALRRLGGSRTMADVRQARWKEKKSLKPPAPEGEKEETETKETQDDEQKASSSVAETTALPLDEKAAAVVKLTELVDSLVNEGEFEVYGYTYEKISHELEKYRKLKVAKDSAGKATEEKKPIEQGDDDAALDMFADEIDEKKLQEESAAKQKEPEQKADGKCFWSYR